MTERRALYRVAPEDADDFGMTVRPTQGDGIESEILDLTVEGAGGRIHRARALALQVGDPVGLRFRAPEMVAPVDVQAHVVDRAEVGDFRHFSFRFANRAGIERQLPQSFYRLFNRRGVVRAAAPNDQRVSVHFVTLRDAPTQRHAEALLCNISATGLGAVAGIGTARTLADTDYVRARLALPGSSRGLDFTAWIRHREVVRSNVFYGLMFDTESTHDFLGQAEDIVDFVLTSYQRTLDARH